MRRRDLICGVGAVAIAGRLRYRRNCLFEVDNVSSSPHLEEDSAPAIVAGIRLIDSSLARRATQLARTVSAPYLFNHAVRTFLFGSLIGRNLGEKFDEEVLYLACVLHDLGLTEKFQGDLPFEIQGAEAAKVFLQKQSYSAAKIALVWDGIAMHASPIGEFKQPEISLVGAGAGADVLGPDPSQISKAQVHEIVNVYPRLGFSEAFTKACADVVRRHPTGAGHSFMRDIAERYVPGYRPRNFCDLISETPFSDVSKY